MFEITFLTTSARAFHHLQLQVLLPYYLLRILFCSNIISNTFLQWLCLLFPGHQFHQLCQVFRRKRYVFSFHSLVVKDSRNIPQYKITHGFCIIAFSRRSSKKSARAFELVRMKASCPGSPYSFTYLFFLHQEARKTSFYFFLPFFIHHYRHKIRFRKISIIVGLLFSSH